MAREAVTIEFTGLENLQEIFNKLPAVQGKKIVQAAFRKASKPFVQALKAAAPGSTGKAVGIKAGKGPFIAVGFIGKGDKKFSYFKAYWKNYGTLANRDASHTFRSKRKPKYASRRGGIVPERFVERSWEETKDQVEKSVQTELIIQTDKLLKKYAI